VHTKNINFNLILNKFINCINTQLSKIQLRSNNNYPVKIMKSVLGV